MAQIRDSFGNPYTGDNYSVTAGAFGDHLCRINKFGWSNQVAAGKVTVASWLGDIYSYPGSASLFGFASESTSDVLSGGGAHRIEVQGCSSGFLEYSETLDLNGQNPVYTSEPMIRINRMKVLEVGSIGVNADNIYCGVNSFTNGVPDNIYSRVDSGRGQTLQSIYTVPANCNVYITQVYFNIEATKATTLEFVVREQERSFRIQELIEVNQSGLLNYSPWRAFNQKTDIEIRALGANPAIAIGAGFGMTLQRV